MKKLFSMLLVVSILVITLGVVAISTTAATEVVVWEGDINREFTTSRGMALITVDSLNQAIQDDIALNDTASKYVLTSSGSYYVRGESNYAMWGFYQERPEYVEAWANKISSLNDAIWTETEQLSHMSPSASLCLYTEGTDTVYVGHIRLIATHEPQPTETEEDPTATGTKPTATPSIQPTQVREGVTQVYKFTFEDANATSILKVGDKVVGEVVEWPKDSGNHCLRYQVTSETRDRSGCHPYFWPEGIGELLCAQGDLAETGSKIEMKVDFACNRDTHDAYLYPCIVLNDYEETFADRPGWIKPGYSRFESGVFSWSSYKKAPTEGRANGGIGFYDDYSLPESAYIYIDNVEFNWIGDWIELEKVFVGYPGGIPCEESDMEIVKPTDPTVTGTETETGAQPTETVTEAEPTETEIQPTATEVEPTAKPTAEPTETGTEPTAKPTDEPTAKPTAEPTEPVIEPTDEPTVAPTEEPTSEETVAPTDAPTDAPKDIIYGDANGDGTVNMKDVLMIRKYIAELPVDIALDAADANGDGVVNMKDVLIVRKYIAGLIDILGA